MGNLLLRDHPIAPLTDPPPPPPAWRITRGSDTSASRGHLRRTDVPRWDDGPLQDAGQEAITCAGVTYPVKCAAVRRPSEVVIGGLYQDNAALAVFNLLTVSTELTICIGQPLIAVPETKISLKHLCLVLYETSPLGKAEPCSSLLCDLYHRGE